MSKKPAAKPAEKRCAHKGGFDMLCIRSVDSNGKVESKFVLKCKTCGAQVDPRKHLPKGKQHG